MIHGAVILLSLMAALGLAYALVRYPMLPSLRITTVCLMLACLLVSFLAWWHSLGPLTDAPNNSNITTGRSTDPQAGLSLKQTRPRVDPWGLAELEQPCAKHARYIHAIPTAYRGHIPHIEDLP